MVAAALVHVFTGLGSVCALLATLEVVRGNLEWAFGWLLVALFIDAIDGTMARALDVAGRLPRFSGERLDLVIDYLTYVFVPVLALLQGRVLGGLGGGVIAALILLSSLYHFADTESKADDNCFIGFPAVWNLVAFCLLAWGLDGIVAGAVLLALVCLTFVPMRWLHPMRVRQLLLANLAATALGLASGAWILLQGFPAGGVAGTLLALSAGYFVVLAFVWPRTSQLIS